MAPPAPATRNPFHTLYVTEALETGDAYWRWFSPEIITGEITSLFRPGNTVLLGTNGAGKTMLLRLFSPEVCAAFLRSKRPSPIPEADRGFLSIGVHVIHDGFAALGGRAVDKDAEVNRQLWALMVGDLLNYHFVAKLVDTLYFLRTRDGKPLADDLGLDLSLPRLARFARQLAAHQCWRGALANRRTLPGVRVGLRGRIHAYRNWFNWNRDSLPKGLTRTKSEIGEPLTAARTALTECGIAPAELQLIVTIDQYESLVHTDYESREAAVSFGHTFCRVVNSFIAGRNPQVRAVSTPVRQLESAFTVAAGRS